MSYVIATDSRRRDEILFMVDRRKQRASFWSNRLTDAFVYADRAAAALRAKSFRFNRPRVMPLKDAARLLHEHEDQRAWEAGMYAVEAGWDGHKNVI